MKKNKGLFLFLVGLLMFLPIGVFAQSPTTELTGVLYAKPGETVAYDIKITSSDDVKASKYVATLDYDKDILELKSVSSKSWSGSNSGNNLSFTYKDGVTGTSTIATVTFKIKNTVPKQTTIISLKDIKVTTIGEDDTQSIVTIAENASHKVSLAIKSTDNTLKDLKLDGKTIDKFKSSTFEYEIEVPSDTDKIELKATPNNANATFVDDFGNRKLELKYGENEVLVKVKSESGEIQVYKLLITREDDRNTNNNLKEVIINSGKIKLELSKNKVNYTVKTYKLKTLEVDAVAVDSKAKVDVKIPEEIIVGDNVVTITVTSENGEEKVYTINFENSDKTIDTKIKTLYIKGYNIEFDKNTMVYDIVLNRKYKSGLDFRIVTVSGTDLVEYKIYYNGEEIKSNAKLELKPGDKYEIKVIPIGMEEGEEADSTIYTINILKDKRVSFYFVLELFIIIVLIILIIIQIIKRNKQRKNKEEKSAKEKNKMTEESLEEVSKTKVLSTQELDKINNKSKE